MLPGNADSGAISLTGCLILHHSTRKVRNQVESSRICHSYCVQLFFLYKERQMAEETIFSKIIRREIPADVVYQDELVTAFRDISPQAPTHILIVPNVLIPTINDVTVEHEAALGRMITAAARIADQEGVAEDGYRLIINCNRHGGQEVYHIHMHLVGGRSLGPLLSR
ncbi:HIT-like protein HI_0961 [Serratia quinivorans]|nr:HIT-like protein HI_0961 [Serratia quinivorans]CAI1547298.1 HIT-like protein HI_0961 [Serratia quinivorans]